jgi:hypothetical protein
MSLSKRDWALIISGIAGGEAGKKFLKKHPTLGGALGALAASYTADKAMEALSSDQALLAERARARLLAVKHKIGSDDDGNVFIDEMLSEATPEDLLAGFTTGKMPQWYKNYEAAEKEKSLTRSWGEEMAIEAFVDRLRRVRSTDAYDRFWKDWRFQDVPARKKTILRSLDPNADSSVFEAGKEDRANIVRMLDEQEGIDRVVEPSLRTYENTYSRMKFMFSSDTRGFYEIHRVLVGHIECLA